MGTDEHRTDGTLFPVESAGLSGESSRLSRRQALGTMSVAATAGAAAWAVPEILTAKPAAGAPMSMPGGGNGGGDGDGNGGGKGHKGPNGSAPVAVVEPGTVFPVFGRDKDIAQSVEVGAAMVGGGWAFHRWQSRKADGAPAIGEVHSGGDIGDPA